MEPLFLLLWCTTELLITVILGLAEKQRQKTDSDYGKKDDLFLRFLVEDEVARPLQNARAALNTHHTQVKLLSQ
jgi:hypothetical protein